MNQVMRVKTTASVSPLLQGRFVFVVQQQDETAAVDVIYWDTRRSVTVQVGDLEAVPPQIAAAVAHQAMRATRHDDDYNQLTLAVNALRHECTPQTADGLDLLLAPTNLYLEELPSLEDVRQALARYYGETAVPATESFQPWWSRLMKAITRYNEVEAETFGVPAF